MTKRATKTHRWAALAVSILMAFSTATLSSSPGDKTADSFHAYLSEFMTSSPTIRPSTARPTHYRTPTSMLLCTRPMQTKGSDMLASFMPQTGHVNYKAVLRLERTLPGERPVFTSRI